MIHVITTKLKQVLQCEIVKSNQIHKKPPYPYVSFTITTPVHAEGGTYCEAEDGTRYRDLLQTWSVTVQSEKDNEANELAMKAFDWFQVQGNFDLQDNGIVVADVSDITNRDNLISIEYEYRYGFDVTFRMRHEITRTKEEQENTIETIDLNKGV